MEPRLPEPKLRDDFRRELRARLMQEAVTALAPRPRGTAWTFIRPALGVGLAGILLVAGAGTAAAGSVPGDVAFPLKRAVEDLQVTLTFDDVSRVELLAQIADRRLAELQRVVDSDDTTKAPTASEEFAAAVARFRAAVDAVQQAAPEDKSDLVQDLVDAAREKHDAVLDEVKDRLDNEKAQQAIERAKENEDKDTAQDKKNRGDGAKTPRPSQSARPSQQNTPRATSTPRASQRR
jgi:hypothetical protein